MQTGIAIEGTRGKLIDVTFWKSTLVEAMQNWDLNNNPNNNNESGLDPNLTEDDAEMKPKSEHHPTLLLENITVYEAIQRTQALVQEKNLVSRILKTNIIEITAPTPYDAVLEVKFSINEHEQVGAAIEKVRGKDADLKECEAKLTGIMKAWDLPRVSINEIDTELQFSSEFLFEKKQKVMDELEQHADLIMISKNIRQIMVLVNNVSLSIDYYNIAESPNSFGVKIENIQGHPDNFNAVFAEIKSVLLEEN